MVTWRPSIDLKSHLEVVALTYDLCLQASGLTSGKHVRVMLQPLKPHFYIAKLRYAGVYLFFLFLLQNIDCGYSLEPPQPGGSNVYPQSMF